MPNSAAQPYRGDLAYIHDTGFGSFARHASSYVLRSLKQRKLPRGLIVELGCGSGISSAAFTKAGYGVLGYDISPAMVALARKHAPRGRFRCESFLDAPLPRCVAVTAIGEVFNYLFDRQNTPRRLYKLFERVHEALLPGGLFIFDGAEPGRIAGKGRRRHGIEGADWACLVDSEENRDQQTLVRRITSFRRVGALFRRDREIHRQRLFDRAEIATELRGLKFRVRTFRHYGDLKFPPGYIGFAARKVD